MISNAISGPIRRNKIKLWGMFSAVSLLSSFSLAQAAGIVLEPGIILDRDNQMVYAMQQTGGLEARSVEAGTVVWQSTSADKPLALIGDQLVAQSDSRKAGQIDITVFSAANGDLSRSYQQSLPDEFRTDITEQLGSRFSVDSLNQESPLILSWSSEDTGTASGALPSAEEQLTNRQMADVQAGLLSLDLENARLTELDRRPSNATAPSTDRRLSFQADSRGRAYRSEDGEYILVSERVADSSQWLRYEWRIYDQGNRLIGKHRSHLAYSPFTVIENTLLFITNPVAANGIELDQELDTKSSLTPRSLHAINLADNSQSWSMPVRDLSYRGPYPH